MTSSINASMGAREWLMLVALSVLWGGSFFFVGVAVTELPPLTIVTLRVGLAAITLWSIALLMGYRPPKIPGVWLAFFGMVLLNNVIPFVLIVWAQTQIASGLAVLSTAIAYVLYFKILESADATNLLLDTLLIPVSAVLLGALFLNETLEPVHFIGMAFIIIYREIYY